MTTWQVVTKDVLIKVTQYLSQARKASDSNNIIKFRHAEHSAQFCLRLPQLWVQAFIFNYLAVSSFANCFAVNHRLIVNDLLKKSTAKKNRNFAQFFRNFKELSKKFIANALFYLSRPNFLRARKQSQKPQNKGFNMKHISEDLGHLTEHSCKEFANARKIAVGSATREMRKLGLRTMLLIAEAADAGMTYQQIASVIREFGLLYSSDYQKAESELKSLISRTKEMPISKIRTAAEGLK